MVAAPRPPEGGPQGRLVEREHLNEPWRARVCLVTVAASSTCDASPATTAIRNVSCGFVIWSLLLRGSRRR